MFSFKLNQAGDKTKTDLEEKKKKKKKKRLPKNEFIDDEAELSSEDEDKVSDDEFEESDDDVEDLDLVDKEAQELDSEQEEEVRGLYHKQIEQDDKRAVLVLREQLEDKYGGLGQRRRRRFRWQTKELMEDSLRRHYDPDDDDSQTDDDEDDNDNANYSDIRIRRPNAESLLVESAQRVAKKTPEKPATAIHGLMCDDSNSMSSRPSISMSAMSSRINRFVYHDREVVQALSTKETVVEREDKDKLVQREIRRVLQTKSIFDQLYS